MALCKSNSYFGISLWFPHVLWMPGGICLCFPHVLSMTGNTSGKFSFCGWWDPSLLCMTGVHHWLEVMLRFFSWYTRAIWSFLLHTENLFLQNWCKNTEASASQHLHSGSCHVQEGYHSLVFMYCLEFSLRAITNATQVISVVPPNQSPWMCLLVWLYLLTVLIYLCTGRDREHGYSPVPQS